MQRCCFRMEPFLSTPSARRATLALGIQAYNALKFLSTPSVRRATAHHNPAGLQRENFYPRPPRGGRHGNGTTTGTIKLFLSTPSARRATKLFCKDGEVSAISIHALREEGDRAKMELSRNQNNFYPRPPRGGRLGVGHGVGHHIDISIHALREEGDGASHGQSTTACYFYPRPPRGGRLSRLPPDHDVDNFYPRPPRGGRRTAHIQVGFTEVFLSTPSARRATFVAQKSCGHICIFLSTPSARRATGSRVQGASGFRGISIHALRGEGDGETWQMLSRRLWNFYPRPPRGGRHGLGSAEPVHPHISIHALREEGDDLPA